MSTHTPGRLVVRNSRIYEEGPTVDCIATMQTSNQVAWEEDAARLVACWNALENVPDEELAGIAQRLLTNEQMESIAAAIRSLRYGAHPHRSPHADDLVKLFPEIKP